MITIDYDRNLGWSDPVLRPFENLHLNPFSSCLNYGVQCYEGTKAYKNDKGEVRLFRVEQNALRFKRSSIRLTLPDFDGQELVSLIMRLVREDEKWIPPISECSLYIRPFHLGISETLGVHSPEKSKMVIAASPVGSYYSAGFKPISLYCETDTIRSAPKGTGNYKIGG
jgi:branched-chain amino acid aminotransferase